MSLLQATGPRLQRRAVAAVLSGSVMAAVVLAGQPAAVRADDAQAEQEASRPERVILFSLPRTTWAMLAGRDLPNLQKVFDSGATASLSTRSATAYSSLENGYATLGAGNRADAGSLGAAAFNRSEEVDNSTACQTYRRRTGWACDGDILQLGIVDAVVSNELELYDAEVGTLGSALRDAGLHVAVFGNADGPVLTDESRRDVADQPAFEPVPLDTELPTEQALAPTVQLGRSVAFAGMNRRGIVERGTVSEKSLLIDDPRFPYGVRMSNAKTMERIQSQFADLSYLVVEASDLERVDRAKRLATVEQNDELIGLALANADELLGQLIAMAPLEENLYMIVSPAPPRGIGGLTVFAMAGRGVESGLAVSATTRRAGYVELTGVAPTVLAALGVEAPDDVTGRRITATGKPWTIEGFIRANEQGIVGEQLRKPAFLAFVVAFAVLLVSAAAYFYRRPSSKAFTFAAVWSLYLPVSMFLVVLLPFASWTTGVNLVVMGSIALVLALLTWPLRRFGSLWCLGAALSVTLAVSLVDLVSGTHLQLNSVLGYSPIVAGRFTGTGNLGWALMVTCTILVAGLAVSTWKQKGLALTFAVALFAVVVVVDGAPMWGADVGGILTTVPSFAVAFTLLAGRRIKFWPMAVAIGVTTVLVGTFALIDLSRPEDAQTHLAGTINTFLSGGWDALWTIIRRKMDANISIMRKSSFAIMLPLSVAYIVWLSVQRPGLPRIIEKWPFMRAALWSILVAGILGALTNDSGVAIPAMMLGVVAPTLLYLRAVGDFSDDFEEERVRTQAEERRSACLPDPVRA